MTKLHISIAFSLAVFWAVFASASSSTKSHLAEQNFLHCLESSNDPNLSEVVYTQEHPDFLSVLNFYIQNSRFLNEETPKPKLIVAPVKESQVQRVIKCSKGSGLQIRVRSGGHDFEGSSYISEVPFFILDIDKFRSISIDEEKKTIWFGAGATLGEIYYAVYKKNSSLTVAMGNWPTVSVGGHISGGGYGGLTRQYGLAADQVIDAVVVDAKGEIHDRKSMGEDFFWAIRGGIGSNFGVILAYQLKLVDVPDKVVSFFVSRTLEENAVQLLHKAQTISPTLPLHLSFSIQFATVLSNQTSKPTVEASFICTYRGAGGIHELLSIMDRKFPELGVTKDDIFEMLWIQFVPFHNRYPIDDYVHYLISRIPPAKPYFSAKADFVRDPIPETGIQGLMNKLLEVPLGIGQMEWTFWGGGVMDKIPESDIPFPHRGYLYVVFEVVYWNGTDTSSTIEDRLNWLRGFHREFGSYVPSNPRPAYADYRDHDLGLNSPDGTTTVERARTTWGGPYFGVNFDRLVRLKSEVDPGNLFRNEQGFPVIGLPLSESEL